MALPAFQKDLVLEFIDSTILSFPVARDPAGRERVNADAKIHGSVIALSVLTRVGRPENHLLCDLLRVAQLT